MPGILVVEDDENLNRGITFSLKKSGYEVFSAESVKKAKRIASDNNVDVTICDVNLPDGNGLEFVRWMRCNYNTYIICLTALDQEMDQVMGYEAGADDYITKPFAIEELLARIRRALKKSSMADGAGTDGRSADDVKEAAVLANGDGRVKLDKKQHIVTVDCNNVELTQREFAMLQTLLENMDIVLSRETLLDKVCGYDYVGETNIVDVYVRYLRSKIDDAFGIKLIQTVRGVGYVIRSH